MEILPTGCYFNCDDESAFIPYPAAADIWGCAVCGVMVFEPVGPNFEALAMQQFRTAVANRQHFSASDKRAITMFWPAGIQAPFTRASPWVSEACSF